MRSLLPFLCLLLLPVAWAATPATYAVSTFQFNYTDMSPDYYLSETYLSRCVNDDAVLSVKTGTVATLSNVPVWMSILSVFNVSLGSQTLSLDCSSAAYTLTASLPSTSLVMARSSNGNATSTFNGFAFSMKAYNYTNRWLWSGTMRVSNATVGGVSFQSGLVAINDYYGTSATTLWLNSTSPLAMNSSSVTYNFNATTRCTTITGSPVNATLSAKSKSNGGTHAMTGNGTLTYNDCLSSDAAWAFTGTLAPDNHGTGLVFTGKNLTVSASKGSFSGAAWNATVVGTGQLGGLPGTFTGYLDTSGFYTQKFALDAYPATFGDPLAHLTGTLTYWSSGYCWNATGPTQAWLNVTGGGVASGSGTLTISNCSSTTSWTSTTTASTTPSWSASLNLASISLGNVTAPALTATISRSPYPNSRWAVTVNGTGVLGGSPLAISGVASDTATTPTFTWTAAMTQTPTPTSPLGFSLPYATLTIDPHNNCTNLTGAATLYAPLGGTSNLTSSTSAALSFYSCPAIPASAWSVNFTTPYIPVSPYLNLTSSLWVSATRALAIPTGYERAPWVVTFAGKGTFGSGLNATLTGTLTNTTRFTASGSLALGGFTSGYSTAAYMESGSTAPYLTFAAASGGTLSYDSQNPSAITTPLPLSVSTTLTFAAQTLTATATLGFSNPAGVWSMGNWAATNSAFLGSSTPTAAWTGNITSASANPGTGDWVGVFAAPLAATSVSAFQVHGRNAVVYVGTSNAYGSTGYATLSLSPILSSSYSDTPLAFSTTLPFWYATTTTCRKAWGTGQAATLSLGSLQTTPNCTIFYNDCLSNAVHVECGEGGAYGTTISNSNSSSSTTLTLSTDVTFAPTLITATLATLSKAPSTWALSYTGTLGLGANTTFATANVTIAASSKSLFTVASTAASLSNATVGGFTLWGVPGGLTLAHDGSCATASGAANVTLTYDGGYAGSGGGPVSYSSCTSAAKAWSLPYITMANTALGNVSLTKVYLSAHTTPASTASWVVNGTGSATLFSPASSTITFASMVTLGVSGGVFASSANATFSAPNFLGYFTLPLSPSYAGTCATLPVGGGTINLRFGTTASLIATSASLTYSPCTQSFTVYGTGGGASWAVGGHNLYAKQFSLGYNATKVAWSGTLIGIAVSGDSYTGDVSVTFTNTSSMVSPSSYTVTSRRELGGGRFLSSTTTVSNQTYPNLWGSIASSVPISSTCASTTAVDSGSASFSLTNLPGGLPDATLHSGGLFHRTCSTGAWYATVALPPFTFDLGPNTGLALTSPTLTATYDATTGGVSLSYSATSGYLTFTIAVSSAGAVSVSAVETSATALSLSSLFSTLTGTTLPSIGPSDLITPALAATVYDVSLSVDFTTRCLTVSATLASLFGASGVAMGGKLCGTYTTSAASGSTKTTYALTYALNLPLSFSTMTTLPTAITTSMSSSTMPSPSLSFSNINATSPAAASNITITRASTSYGASLSSMAFKALSGTCIQAPSYAMTGLSVTGVTLCYSVPGSAAASMSMSGAGTVAMGSGFTSALTFSLSGAGVFSGMSMALTAAPSTYPFSFVGTLAYVYTASTGLATGSGTITTMAFNLGGRSLSLLSTGSVTFSTGGGWSVSAALSSVTISGFALPGITATLTRAAGASDWGVSLAGVATDGGVSSTVTVLYASYSSYTVTAVASYTSPTATFTTSFSVGDSAASCPSFYGTVSALSLSLRGDTLAISTGLTAFYSPCTGGMSLATTSATTLTTHGLSLTLASFSLTRASTTSGWVGSLMGSAGSAALATNAYFSGSASLALSFSSIGVSSALLSFALSSGSDLYVSGGLSITHPTYCPTGGVDSGYLYVSSTTTFSSAQSTVAIKGTGYFSRSCSSGSGAWSVTLTDDAKYSISMAVATVSISGLSLTYSSATDALALTGTLDNAVLVSVSGSPKTSTYTLSASLAHSTTVGSLYTSVTGGSSLSPGGALDALFNPVSQATITTLSLALEYSTGLYCLYYQVTVGRVFGAGSVSMGAQLCKSTSTGLYWTIGVPLDFSKMDFPGGAMSMLASSCSSPVLSVGGGTSALASGTAIAFPSGFSSSFTLYRTSSFSISTSLAMVGSAIGDLLTLIKASPSKLGTSISNLGSQVSVTIALASVDDVTLSISFASADSSTSMGNGVVLSSLALGFAVAPASLSVYIAAAVSAVVGSGTHAQTLTGAGTISFQVSAGVLSLDLALGVTTSTGVWSNPFGMGSSVGVLMPVTLNLGVGLVGPLPFLTAFGFSGGMYIGSTSAYVALQANLANIAQSGFQVRVSGFSPLTLMATLSGCSSCFPSSVTTILNALLSGNFALSINPSGSDIAIGPYGAQAIIPAGTMLAVSNVHLLEVLYIKQASIAITSSGIATSAILGPLRLGGVLSITSAGSKSKGPSYALQMATSGKFSFSLSGSVTLFGDTSSVSAAISSDTSFSLTTSSHGAGFASSSFSCSGKLSNPAGISITLQLYLSTDFTAGAISAISNYGADAQSDLSTASSALTSVNSALSSASSALNALQNSENQAVAKLQNAATVKSNECNDYSSKKSSYGRSCSWRRLKDCVEKVYYSSLYAICEVSYRVIEASISATKNVYDDATTAAQGAFYVAERAVSSAQTTVTSCNRVVTGLVNLATSLAKFEASCFSISQAYITTTLSLKEKSSATLSVDSTINGKAYSFTVVVSYPFNTAAITSTIGTFADNYFKNTVLPSLSAAGTFATSSNRRRLHQIAPARHLDGDDSAYADTSTVDTVTLTVSTGSSWDDSMATNLTVQEDATGKWANNSGVYVNASGVWQYDPSVIVAPHNSSTVTSWYPCETCNSTGTSSTIATNSRRQLWDQAEAHAAQLLRQLQLSSSPLPSSPSQEHGSSGGDTMGTTPLPRHLLSSPDAGSFPPPSLPPPPGGAPHPLQAPTLPTPRALSVLTKAQFTRQHLQSWGSGAIVPHVQRSGVLSTTSLCSMVGNTTVSVSLSNMVLEGSIGVGGVFEGALSSGRANFSSSLAASALGYAAASESSSSSSSSSYTLSPAHSLFLTESEATITHAASLFCLLTAPNLKDIFLSSVQGVVSTSGFFSGRKGEANLTTLHLRDCAITGALGEFAPATLPALKDLAITDAPGFTGSLAVLSNAPLTKLVLTNTSVTYSGTPTLPAFLASLHNLSSVRLDSLPSIPYASLALQALPTPRTRLLLVGHLSTPPYTTWCSTHSDCASSSYPALCASHHCTKGVATLSTALKAALRTTTTTPGLNGITPPWYVGGVTLLPLSSTLLGFRAEVFWGPAVDARNDAFIPDMVGVAAGINAPRAASGTTGTPSLVAALATLLASSSGSAGVASLTAYPVCGRGLAGPGCTLFCGTTWETASPHAFQSGSVGGGSQVLRDHTSNAIIPRDTTWASMRSSMDRCMVPGACSAGNCSAGLAAMFTACDALLFNYSTDTAATTPCAAAATTAARACSALGAQCQAMPSAILATISLLPSTTAIPATPYTGAPLTTLVTLAGIAAPSSADLLALLATPTYTTALVAAQASLLSMDPRWVNLTDISSGTPTSDSSSGAFSRRVAASSSSFTATLTFVIYPPTQALAAFATSALTKLTPAALSATFQGKLTSITPPTSGVSFASLTATSSALTPCTTCPTPQTQSLASTSTSAVNLALALGLGLGLGLTAALVACAFFYRHFFIRKPKQAAQAGAAAAAAEDSESEVPEESAGKGPSPAKGGRKARSPPHHLPSHPDTHLEVISAGGIVLRQAPSNDSADCEVATGASVPLPGSAAAHESASKRLAAIIESGAAAEARERA